MEGKGRRRKRRIRKGGQGGGRSNSSGSCSSRELCLAGHHVWGVGDDSVLER